MSQDVAIRCENVWKSYRIYHQRSHSLKERILTRRNAFEEFWALKDLSFEVPVGSTLGIIGSNGSGKSTLLKVIARILTANRGTVETFGTMSSLLELGTGFHPELTGRENVYLAGSLLGQRKKEIERRYDEIVHFAGIEEFMELPVKNYSSGMYARLAFATAISVEPDILLIDEVLSVGDEEFQMRCFERIAEFRSQGRTIVLVSHGLENIRSLCSDAIWIDHGDVRAMGPSHEVVGGYLTEVHGNAEHFSTTAPGDRYGSLEAQIVGVDVLDGSGTTQGAFRTGDPMSIRVRYRAETAITGAVCVIQIFSADTLTLLYGQSNLDARLPLVLDGDGLIELHVPELALLPGSFVVNVSLQDEVSSKKIYDCHERRYNFMVFENAAVPYASGVVHLRATWTTSAHVPQATSAERA